MNKLQRARLKVTLRNTWPFYVVSAVLVTILINLFFNITHKAPDYKTWAAYFISVASASFRDMDICRWNRKDDFGWCG